MEGNIEKEYKYKNFTFYKVRTGNCINLISGN